MLIKWENLSQLKLNRRKSSLLNWFVSVLLIIATVLGIAYLTRLKDYTAKRLQHDISCPSDANSSFYKNNALEDYLLPIEQR